MDYFIRLAQLHTLWWSVPMIIGALIARYYAKVPFYSYPLTRTLARAGHTKAPTHKRVFAALKIMLLAILALLIAKPQLVDSRSTISIDGIDIMIVLDASASMQFQDFDDDQRSRFQVAKDEAVRFVDKRIDDAIGLVLFGKDALSRIPLTMDKKLINSIISGLQLGFIDPDGTVLATAIISGANRLKNSEATSKVMIVLTDGAPSENDTDPALAIELAQKLGIKIYTIGIGSDEDQYVMHPFMGLIPKPKINRPLLVKIAQDTGGKFFLARNSKDMRAVYDTIDSLERTSRQTSLYNKYYDIFIPGLWACIALMLLELLLSATIWFGL
ncbi:VWA domain-containing protein [soil metagenome]